MWGAAADDVWAVGDGGTLAHYDGATWSAVASPTTQPLNAVWGSGPGDVWVAGYAKLHYDGATWAVVGPPSPIEFAVWGTGANDVYSAGIEGVAHWNGAAWTKQAIGTSNILFGLAGGGSDVWTVGQGVTVLRHGP